MSIELLEMTNEEFLTRINKYPEFGSFSVLSNEEAMDMPFDLNSGDICISYDYCVEGEEEVTRAFSEWKYEECFKQIAQFMYEKGYEEIDQWDGDGGGLYYGGVQFRKI